VRVTFVAEITRVKFTCFPERTLALPGNLIYLNVSRFENSRNVEVLLSRSLWDLERLERLEPAAVLISAALERLEQLKQLERLEPLRCMTT
jgi:hypothetical protein